MKLTSDALLEYHGSNLTNVATIFDLELLQQIE